MIIKQTVMNVSDNSGAKLVRCIGMGSRRKSGVGMIVKVSVIKAEPNGTVKKGDVYDAVIVTTKAKVNKSDGVLVSYSSNSVVLLNQKKESIGTRISGAVDRSCRVIDQNITSRAEEVH
ncbi:MAG: uL14 family ribosomal protein [Alphaproteobacteria bacterium]|nr:MAG: uL14 family ribosomal protein [Alphaproteobacteria bacterium]